jgi:hypothetical protein
VTSDLLGIYLNDHLAGATFGAGLAERVARRHHRSARSTELKGVAEQVAQDRQALLGVMDALEVPARGYKVGGGWAAEKLSRLKPNGLLHRRSGLSALIDLETLRLGVEGKALLWRTLLAVATTEPRLDATELDELLDRARRQIDTLEALRLTAAEVVLSSEQGI